MFSFRINVDEKLKNLEEQYASQVRAIFDDVGIDLADKLQQESPVGATKGLKEGWDFIPATRRRNSLTVRFSIVNRADAAFNRIAGREPGKMPPWNAGTSLNLWVGAKLGIGDEKQRRSVSFLIARKIARAGTIRYQRRQNILDVDPDSGKYRRGSPILKAQADLIARLNEIPLPKRPGRGSRR